MKHVVFTILIATSLCFGNSKSQDSTIEKVTVFLSGAQITRSANIYVPLGTSEFTIDNLSPYLQESSIQISGLKKASVMAINYSIDFLSEKQYNDAIESLKLRLEELQDNIQLEDHLILGFSEELSILKQNKQLGNNNEVVNLEKLQKFANYFRQRTTEIKNSIYESNQKKAMFSKEISDINNQLNEFKYKDRVKSGTIKIKLSNIISEQLKLIITYNVSNAGWLPVYDLKATDIDEPLQFTYKAHVYQNTGKDWDNAKLTLSTSDPNTNNVKPEVLPKYLNFVNGSYRRTEAAKQHNFRYNPTIKRVSGTVISSSDGHGLPGVNVIVKGTSYGTQTDFDGNYVIDIPNGNTLSYSFLGMETQEFPIYSSVMNINLNEDTATLDEVVIAAYGTSTDTRNYGVKNRVQQMMDTEYDEVSFEEKVNYTSTGDIISEGIANMTFEIQKLYTISSNEDITAIEIDSYEIPATYSYFAAPLLNENVFLTAEIDNFEQYNLLPAEANVYFEGNYTGKTTINPYATSEAITISLGVDPNVVVKREQPQDFKKRGFIGSNKIIDKAFEIEIKNNKSKSIDLVLYDRIPISQNKAIKIENVETYDSNYDEDKGLLKWDLKLDANSQNKKKFSYTLKYPRYKQVNL